MREITRVTKGVLHVGLYACDAKHLADKCTCPSVKNVNYNLHQL